MQIKTRVTSVEQVWGEKMFPIKTGNGRHRTSDFWYKCTLSSILPDLTSDLVDVGTIQIGTIDPLPVGHEVKITIEIKD